MKHFKKANESAMRKWLRDLEQACRKKNVKAVRELVTLEENQRRVGLWDWGQPCFDKETVEEKDDLLHRAFLLSQAAVHTP